MSDTASDTVTYRLQTIADILAGSWGDGEDEPVDPSHFQTDTEPVGDDLAGQEVPLGGTGYDRATTPSGQEMPGARALQNLLLSKFGGSDGGIYDNRNVRGGKSLSVHAEGRAGDVMVDDATGERVASWLVANAERLGVQQVIWNRRVWNTRTGEWRAYRGANDHADHVHWELTRAAAAGTTTTPAQGRTMDAGDDDPVGARLKAVADILAGRRVAADPVVLARTGAPTTAPLAADGPKRDYQLFARERLGDFGWDDAEMGALIALWNKESGWNPKADNPTSTAYGIAQFLDGTWAGTGYRRTSDPYVQIRAGLTYIKQRYGSPSAAWAHFQRKGWY